MVKNGIKKRSVWSKTVKTVRKKRRKKTVKNREKRGKKSRTVNTAKNGQYGQNWTKTGQKRWKMVHHQSFIIDHSSSIIQHPSSIIHHDTNYRITKIQVKQEGTSIQTGQVCRQTDKQTHQYHDSDWPNRAGWSSQIILNRRYALCVTQTKTSSFSEIFCGVPWPHHHHSAFWWTNYNGKFLDYLYLVLFNWPRYLMSLFQCQCFPDGSWYGVNQF